MGKLQADGFVGADTLTVTPLGDSFFLHGEIACLGGIVVSVHKSLNCVGGPTDDPEVATDKYAYNVRIAGAHNLFRYDNTHPGIYPGHQDEHHRHEFDWRTGDEMKDSPRWIGASDWPTLGDVLEEARAWLAVHYEELSRPEEFGELGTVDFRAFGLGDLPAA